MLGSRVGSMAEGVGVTINETDCFTSHRTQASERHVFDRRGGTDLPLAPAIGAGVCA